MPRNTLVAAIAAAGLGSVSHAAIFSGVACLRAAETAYAPAGGTLVFTGPSDTGFASWFGNSTLNQPGLYAFASQGSSLEASAISAVGETFVSTAGTTSRVGSRSAIDLVFTLDEAAVVTIFAQAGGNFGSFTTMSVALGSSSGSILEQHLPFSTFNTVSLAAGTYALSAVITTIVDGQAASGNGYYNISISVPAPGAFATLALAGLAGSRRRRR